MLREMGKNICYFEPRKMVALKKYLLFSELCIFFEQKKAYRYFLSYIIREDTKVWKNHLELFMRENAVQEKLVSPIFYTAQLLETNLITKCFRKISKFFEATIFTPYYLRREVWCLA